ncbi:hypothetical protein [Lichenicoccus sp.]|uniref:hypothetical protein n=1 Tax=Lichenicoccus sp. TaxID=2781899 RepID=UPI003D0D85AE
MQQAAHSGQQSLAFGRPQQAVQQYRRAFDLALARSDADAVGDIGYDLATAQLAAGDPAAALATIQRTRVELAARSAPDFAELDLAQAASLHRLGDEVLADGWAARAQATAPDQATIARASYVRGVIADARGDTAALAAALSMFRQPAAGKALPSADWRADRDELAARLALRQDRAADAGSSALAAAALRRQTLDYADMEQALELTARARLQQGDARQAADLSLQAGESAAARADTADARAWLAQAMMPGADMSTVQAARQALDRLRPANNVHRRR